MKIVVLNGSPKGETSVTMQYVLYIQKRFPEHEIKIIHIAHNRKKIERDEKLMDEVMEEIQASDGVIWAFPLYIFLVHSDYKRFIELIHERNLEHYFKGKYTCALSTSIHFYDHTAHNYIHAICDDLNMKYTGFYSAEMKDLFTQKNQENLYHFADHFFEAIENQVVVTRAYKKMQTVMPVYRPVTQPQRIDSQNKKMVVIADEVKPGSNLENMINQFMQCFNSPLKLIELNQVKMNGGCLGCLHCGFDNICVYDKADDIRGIYEELKKADILVFAGTITDRYLSSTWKRFIDRRFYNTHQRIFTGKQIGYIISGPMQELPNLREILQAMAEWDLANLSDIITDEYDNAADLDQLLQSFAENLVKASIKGYIRPATFLGVAGIKIFRDEIWGNLRFVFAGDHRMYKKTGVYDFPQKKIKMRLMNTVLFPLTRLKSVKSAVQGAMKTSMISPYQNILSKMDNA